MQPTYHSAGMHRPQGKKMFTLLCQRHIADLSGMLRKKGLGRYISANDVDAAQKALMWLKGSIQVVERDWDPLVVSFLEIQAKAEQVLGENYALNGTCRLCAVGHIMHNGDASWIDNVSDAMLAFALAQGLKVG